MPLPGVAGQLWLCGKHVVGPSPEAALARAASTTIVCLCQRHELIDRYPEYVSWLEVQPPARAIWFPVPDLSMRPLEDTRPFLEGLIQRLVAGERLLVHCAAGIGRSGTIAVGVLVGCHVKLGDALATVAAARPMAGPEAGAQMEFLSELAEHCRGNRPEQGR